jgi:membrane-bound lytic murein transglycosylase MltF
LVGTLSSSELDKIKEKLNISGGVKDFAKDLNIKINAQGNIDTQIANLNGDAAKYVSQLQTGAQKDIANTQAGATRYVADRELESNLGVENIRTKGAIDLQGIVNAGMANVENIRGEYGVKGKKVDRSTAILGGLVSAFNF